MSATRSASTSRVAAKVASHLPGSGEMSGATPYDRCVRALGRTLPVFMLLPLVVPLGATLLSAVGLREIDIWGLSIDLSRIRRIRLDLGAPLLSVWMYVVLWFLVAAAARRAAGDRRRALLGWSGFLLLGIPGVLALGWRALSVIVSNIEINGNYHYLAPSLPLRLHAIMPSCEMVGLVLVVTALSRLDDADCLRPSTRHLVGWSPWETKVAGYWCWRLR